MFAIQARVYADFKENLINLAAGGVVYTAAGHIIQIINPAAQIQIVSFLTFAAVATCAKQIFETSSFFKDIKNTWDKNLVVEVLSAAAGYGTCVVIGSPVTVQAVVSLMVLGILVNLVGTRFKEVF